MERDRPVDEGSPPETSVLPDVQLEAQFQHFRSESYSNSVHKQQATTTTDDCSPHPDLVELCPSPMASSASPSPSVAAEEAAAAAAAEERKMTKKNGFELQTSCSAPCSPKGTMSVCKSSTLPHSSATGVVVEGVSPKKSRSLLLSSLLKRLSPKLMKKTSSPKRVNGKEQQQHKPWFVLEVTDRFRGRDRDADAVSESGSVDSDHSLVADEEVAKGGGGRQKGTKRARSVSEEKPTLFRLSPRKVIRGLKNRCNGSGFMTTDHQVDKNIEVQVVAPTFNTPTVTVSRAQEPSTADRGHLPPPMTADGQLKVEQPSIPRLHRVHQPPRTLNILNKIVVRSPQVEKVATKMASVESIGSCSLDVDVTASESSGTADPPDGRASAVSQRTLHSTSGGSHSQNGAATVVETKTIYLQSNADMGEEKFVTHLYLPPSTLGKDDEVKEGEGGDSSTPRRQPSYVNISRSVSGYTSFSCYNSKVREGLRSRDSSPARAAFSTSKSSGVLDTCNDSADGICSWTANSYSLKEQRRIESSNGIALLSAKKGRIPSDRTSPRHVANVISTVNRSASEDYVCNEQTVSVSVHETDSNKSQMKSLVQQRIERLYGPGALAQGFLIRAKARNLYGGVTTTPIGGTTGGGSVARRLTGADLNGSKSDGLFNTTATLKYVPRGDDNNKKSDDKSVGKIIAAVMATPSLLPHDSVSAEAGACRHDVAQVTASSSPHSWNSRTKSLSDKRQMNGHGEGAIRLDSTANYEGQETKPIEDLSTKDVVSVVVEESIVKDGHYFLKTMDVEQQKIESLIRVGEDKLQNGTMTEDMAGLFRVTTGKASLLLSQKFEQFRGLCKKNLTQLPDEPFPTTASDLAGFWDMVLIQVHAIYDMFRDIDILQDSEWQKRQECEVDGVKRTEKLSNGVKTKRVREGRKSATPSPRTPKAEEAARAREEARKRLAEVKRKARNQLSAHNLGDQQIEIFTPENKE